MSKVVSGTLVIALIGAGGYVWADINDRVPGMLTNSPEIPAPEPFPTVVFPDLAFCFVSRIPHRADARYAECQHP
jgi:D-alanyl-D-alanine carboxypeptidase/D-alanyl-D-alanine-endopeptidase (penicillin-binding protein 4)